MSWVYFKNSKCGVLDTHHFKESEHFGELGEHLDRTRRPGTPGI